MAKLSEEKKQSSIISKKQIKFFQKKRDESISQFKELWQEIALIVEQNIELKHEIKQLKKRLNTPIPKKDIGRQGFYKETEEFASMIRVILQISQQRKLKNERTYISSDDIKNKNLIFREEYSDEKIFEILENLHHLAILGKGTKKGSPNKYFLLHYN
jgi:hypothetical protein